MVVGHIPMDYTCSLMCANHRDMTAHTPDFITKSGTTHVYAEHIVHQLAALKFEPATCAFIPCAVHSSTTFLKVRGL